MRQDHDLEGVETLLRPDEIAFEDLSHESKIHAPTAIARSDE